MDGPLRKKGNFLRYFLKQKNHKPHMCFCGFNFSSGGWFGLLTASKLSEVRISCISGKAFQAKGSSSAKLIWTPKVPVQGKNLKSRKAAKMMLKVISCARL